METNPIADKVFTHRPPSDPRRKHGALTVKGDPVF